MMRNKIVLLLLLIIAGGDICRGQFAAYKNITVHLVNEDGTPYIDGGELFVYSSYERAVGDKNEKIPTFAKSIVTNPEHIYFDDGGNATINAPMNGTLIIYRMVDKDPMILVQIKGQMDIKVTIKSSKDDGRRLKQVNVNALKDDDQFEPEPPEQFGLEMPLLYPLHTSKAYSLNNARFVVRPIAVNCNTEDTFKIMKPYIVDGGQYKVTQKRRMLYEEKHDPLIQYRVDSVEMQTRERVDFYLVDTLIRPNLKTNLKVYGEMWYEDYNLEYHNETNLLFICEARQPMRFLECNDLIDSININKERYKKNPVAEPHEQPGNLSLNFVVGKAELMPDDSVGRSQLEALKEELRNIESDPDAQINDIYMKGQASPDGSRATNERLGKQRTQFAFNEIAMAVRDRSIMSSESVVAGWEQVADSLASDSTLSDLAQKIRDIVDALPKKYDAQSARIRQLPEYQSKILPTAARLRTVSYAYRYTIKRELTPEEVLMRWQTDSAYRSGKKRFEYYEYGYLFEKVGDPKDLKLLSSRAYQQSKRENPQYPWPLAAFYYAKCSLDDETCDTTILKPLLRENEKGEILRRNMYSGKLEFVYNDPSIVMMQVAMMIKLGAYNRAWHLVQLIKDADGEALQRLKMFLICLRGGYKKNRQAREFVMNTSPLNKAVLLVAMKTEDYNLIAEEHMNDTTLFPDQKDCKLLYLKAIVAGRQHKYYEPTDILANCPYIYECCKQDEEYYTMMCNDGDFTEDFRKYFNVIWKEYKKNGDQSVQDNYAPFVM
ncbi:MAG: hypothetical protein J6B92_02585 [Paraprevotella sp.]|nr:hypothetical protein [Paraprevotella sp.]